jgi:hypothetical protein
MEIRRVDHASLAAHARSARVCYCGKPKPCDHECNLWSIEEIKQRGMIPLEGGGFVSQAWLDQREE